MKTRAWIFFGGAGTLSLLALWGCQFSTVDRTSAYADQYEASAPPLKDGGDASKPKPVEMEASTDDDSGTTDDAGPQDSGTND